MFIDENKELAGNRASNLAKLLPTRNVGEAGHVKGRKVFGVTVDRLAHIVAAVAELGQGLAAVGFDG